MTRADKIRRTMLDLELSLDDILETLENAQRELADLGKLLADEKEKE